ncbi:hypothetical protein [Myxococcus sp. RHSTA-1-4]|uniref:hypothetical protein n=1 Tax=Myxococcus sp. RHSTA-1-4 TaxID=2874601 RepID=UPI001CED6A67|nr:hypothetical protein [Myxococcus sp. RHSTA-1-4]MBZ4422832.1 hypothetical protein [Myxococcus sp. RHSTA-1-4]
MTSSWQRRRQPDDVPTPVAVAVSDFCRRAKSPAPAPEVREALALLAEDDDFRVRALTDGEPEVSPLGPFAVVDVLRGTPPALAAQRQACGFYDVVRELAQVREEKTPPPAPAPSVPTFATPPTAEGDGKAGKKGGKAAKEAAVQERIAPRKRPVGESDTDEGALPLESYEDAGLPRRELPRPRGRFTRVEAPRSSFMELTRLSTKPALEAALEAAEHRFALQRNLSQRYNGSRGELTLVDLENVLKDHGLLDALTDKERRHVLAAYSDQRGASGRVAWSLGLSPSELQRLVSVLGLGEEVEALRERFRREALATPHLTHRLDLLGREKYLADLGIQRKFADSLRKELERLVADEIADATDLHGLADAVGRKHGAPAELVFRAFERLGLATGLRKQLLAGAPPSTP